YGVPPGLQQLVEDALSGKRSALPLHCPRRRRSRPGRLVRVLQRRPAPAAEIMSLLEELGIKPVINASATLTRLGGSIMPPQVLAAMEDASRHWVDLDELQRRIGEELAKITRNKAAYVATGAAAGIALGVAACVTGDAPAKRNRLPDTSGM